MYRLKTDEEFIADPTVYKVTNNAGELLYYANNISTNLVTKDMYSQLNGKKISGHYGKLEGFIIEPWMLSLCEQSMVTLCEQSMDTLCEQSMNTLYEQSKIDESIISPEEYLRLFKQILDRMYDTTKTKNSDYTADCGDAYQNFKVVEMLHICSVEVGFLTRMTDKLSRLSGLVTNREVKVKDEKYEDTLIDLATYSVLMAIYLMKKNKKD